MAKRPVKPAKIERIYILRKTQVDSCNVELKRGCILFPQRIYDLEKKYDSVQKTPGGKTVKFKITDEQAGKLIQENAAVNVKREGRSGPWYACDVYGKKLEEAIPIVIDKPEEKVTG